MPTDAGQQLADFLRYMAQFIEQVSRSLKGGITFRDNVNCDQKVVSLKHGVPQVVSTSKTPATGCIPIRLTSTSFVISGFNWYYSDSGEFTVVARFATQADSATLPTTTLPVTLVIFF